MVPAGPLPVVLAPTDTAVTSPVTAVTRRMTLAVRVTVLPAAPSMAVAPVNVTTQLTVASNTMD